MSISEPIAGPDEPEIGLHPDDPDDEWVSSPARGVRVQAVTGALVLLVVLAGGFWGGVLAEKHHGSGASTSGSSLAAQIRAAARSGGISSLFSSGTAGGTAAGAATTGTVVGEQGDTLFVSDSSGNLVRVTVGPSALVTRTENVALSGLKTGDTVVVTGSKANNGTVNATAVRASAPGTSRSFGGGFGGGG